MSSKRQTREEIMAGAIAHMEQRAAVPALEKARDLGAAMIRENPLENPHAMEVAALNGNRVKGAEERVVEFKPDFHDDLGGWSWSGERPAHAVLDHEDIVHAVGASRELCEAYLQGARDEASARPEQST